jgi:hypothetical protein
VFVPAGSLGRSAAILDLPTLSFTDVDNQFILIVPGQSDTIPEPAAAALFAGCAAALLRRRPFVR